MSQYLLKKPGLFREMTDFRAEAGNIQNMSEATCSARSKKVLKKKKKSKFTLVGVCQKSIRNQLEELPMAKAGIFEQLNK